MGDTKRKISFEFTQEAEFEGEMAAINETDHPRERPSSVNDGYTNEAYQKTEEGEETLAGESPNYAEDSAENKAPQIKLYRRRWLMLLIFVLVSTSNAFQWIEFSIITSIIMK